MLEARGSAPAALADGAAVAAGWAASAPCASALERRVAAPAASVGGLSGATSANWAWSMPQLGQNLALSPMHLPQPPQWTEAAGLSSEPRQLPPAVIAILSFLSHADHPPEGPAGVCRPPSGCPSSAAQSRAFSHRALVPTDRDFFHHHALLRFFPNGGELADLADDAYALTDPAEQGVFGRQAGVGAGDHEELAARGARRLARAFAIATTPRL